MYVFVAYVDKHIHLRMRWLMKSVPNPVLSGRCGGIQNMNGVAIDMSRAGYSTTRDRRPILRLKVKVKVTVT